MGTDKRTKQEIADICQGALKGDEKAWEEIYGWVMSAIFKLGLNLKGEDPEDLAQIILLSLVERIRRGNFEVKKPTSFITFLFYFSRDRVIDYSRKKEYALRLRSVFSLDRDPENDSQAQGLEIADPNPDPWARLKTAMELEYLFECIETLASEKQRLIRLKIKQEAGRATPEEMDEMNATSNLAVKLSRIRAAIRGCIQKRKGGD